MEGEICHYAKFGYCKYKADCKRKHLKEECEKIITCNNIKTSMKRHPKPCKKYASGECKFKSDCAYKHVEPTENKEQIKLEEKVKQLEKVVHQEKNNNMEMNVKIKELEKTVNEMAVKMVQLEVNLKEMESNNDELIKTKEIDTRIKDLKKFPNTKGKTKDQQGKKSKPKDSVFKFGAAARRAESDKIEAHEVENLEKCFKCELCDFKSDKNAHLEKHITLKHSVQKCKVCQREFKSSMDLVSHVAEEQLEDEEELNVQMTSTPTSEKGGLHASFVLSESMLDDVLLEGY